MAMPVTEIFRCVENFLNAVFESSRSQNLFKLKLTEKEGCIIFLRIYRKKQKFFRIDLLMNMRCLIKICISREEIFPAAVFKMTLTFPRGEVFFARNGGSHDHQE